MRALAISVHVPEAAVNKDGAPQAREHQIGGARQIAAVQSKAEAESVGQPPDREFRIRPGAADARHKGAAFINGEAVHGSIGTAAMMLCKPCCIMHTSYA